MILTRNNVLHDWERFWCKPDESYALSDNGFLTDPNGEHGKIFQPNAISTYDLRVRPCLVLLGEPGMGKSTAITNECNKLDAIGQATISVELLRESSATGILRALENSSVFAAWTADDESILYLFLDALDEGLVRNPGLGDEIVELCKSLDLQRLRFRVSCRTLEWPNPIEEKFRSLWSQPSQFEKYELLPLRRRDVLHAAGEEGVDPFTFIEEVIARDAQPLATRPISLRFLLRTFIADGRLPQSKIRLFDEGCRLLCADEGTWETGRPTPDTFRRMAVAARIAAAGTFTNRQLIVRGETFQADAIHVSELVGGSETTQGTTYEVDAAAISDTLQGSSLFSARSDVSFGWAHQSYREFLAAWYLAHHSLDESVVESLYFPTKGPVPAALREVAAWHATFVPTVFDALLERDPDVLMNSDTAAVSAQTRSLLVDALLARMDNYSSHDWKYDREQYRRLDHPLLSAQLRPYILGKEKNDVVRRAAIDIAGACVVQTLVADLTTVLRDGSDELLPREAAARALRSINSEDAREALNDAVVGRLDPDPNDELLGTALMSLWPDHISVMDLFRSLHEPKQSGYLGSYARFLLDVSNTITTADLVAGLEWTLDTVDVSDFSPLRTLREHIVYLALEHLGDQKIATVVVKIANATFARHHNFLDSDARTGRTKYPPLTTDHRRELVRAFIDHGVSEQLGFRLIFNKPPLLEITDLEWLSEHATAAGDGANEDAYAQLAFELLMRFGYPAADLLDKAASAFVTSPIFERILSPFLAAVEIRSARGEEMRKAWNISEESRRRTEGAQSADVVKAEARERGLRRMVEILEHIETGNPSAWAALYFLLTDETFGSVSEAELWKGLVDSDRQRVLSAAQQFLEMDGEVDLAWIDTTSVPGLAFAACGALCLLASSQRTRIDGLSTAAWRRWAHVLVALSSFNDSGVVSEQLIPRALKHAPAEFVAAFSRVVRRDNRLHEHAYVINSVPAPLAVELQPALLGLLDELGDASWGLAIEALVSANNADASRIAIAAMDGAPQRAASAAHAILAREPARWSQVFARMQKDREFAVTFIEAFDDVDDRRISPSFNTLDDMGLAELALTILRLFPEDDRPRNRLQMTLQTPRDQAIRMGDRILSMLAERGSIGAIQWLVDQEPQREALRWLLVNARARHADASWKPVALEQFLRLTGAFFTIEDGAGRISLVFSIPLSAPASVAEQLRRAIVGLKVVTSESALYVSGSEVAVTEMLKMAESNSLPLANNRLVGIRSGSQWLFETVPPVTICEFSQRDASPDELSSLLERVDVLVMTATQTETTAVLSAMRPLPGEQSLVIGALSVDSYSVGRLGNYAVAHCQSGMGSQAPDGSLLTTSDAIKEVKPKVILLIGIAFGVKRDEQRIGDVLVAKHIRPYEMYKAKTETIEERGNPIQASVQLVKFMQDRMREWRFLRADGTPVRIASPGDVLSGQVLVNNSSFRDWLTRRFPTAIGGEMEGIGAYAANSRYALSHILLVKAICDWADGCKNDRAQPFAAAAAVSAVEHLLNRAHVLAPLGIAMLG